MRGPTLVVRLVILVMACWLLSSPSAVRAGLFSALLETLGKAAFEDAGKTAIKGAEKTAARDGGKIAAKDAGEAIRRAGKAATLATQGLSETERGIVEAAMVNHTRVSVVAFDDRQLVLREAQTGTLVGLAWMQTEGIAVVPEHLLQDRSPKLLDFVRHAPVGRVRVVSDDGLWTLRVIQAGGKDALAVQTTETLIMTSEAFETRKALQSVSAASLIARMRIVPMIPRDDAALVAAFGRLDHAVQAPVAAQQALDIIAGSHRKLIVLAGHVEDDAFVVRALANGQELYRLPIDQIYRVATAAEAEVLMLGCDVGTVSRHTGPTSQIFAADVIKALQAVDGSRTGFDLLDTLSQKAGPMIVQDNHAGGFLAISDAGARKSDPKWSLVAVEAGALMRSIPYPPTLLESAGTALSVLLAFLGMTLVTVFLFLPLLAWAGFCFIGMAPQAVWMLIGVQKDPR